jgi:hypothetical protein
MNILDTILYLNPDAKCGVWECPREQYQGESEPVEINGCLIDWNPTNTQPCPTQAELEACDPAAVAAYMNDIREAQRKSARDEQSKKDLALVQSYLGYKVNNPGVSFSEYLDFLESASLEL